MRRWDTDGLIDDYAHDLRLDYSGMANGAQAQNEDLDLARRQDDQQPVRQEAWGRKTGDGKFVLRDLDEEVHSILSSASDKRANGASATSGGVVGSSLGTLTGLFRNVVGGKTLTRQDLEKPLRGMEEHLLKKNVAREAAVSLCEGVERSLVGVKTGSFQSTLFSLPPCTQAH